MPQIEIPVNHNYYAESPISENEIRERFRVKHKRDVNSVIDLFSDVYELNKSNSQRNNIRVVGFKEKVEKNEDDQLILKLYSKKGEEGLRNYFVQTGLYAGVVYHKGVQFNIKTRYGDQFLKRMLNFVLDIYIDNEDVKAEKSEKRNEFDFIIAYLFIQSLEKASILGLPREYQTVKERSHKVRGKIDINSYLRNDIPFRGKLTSSFREQIQVQEIIDVTYLACRKLERKFGREIHSKVFSVYKTLRQSFSGQFSSFDVIQKAQNHRVLHNPMYASFKKVLHYAELILNEKDIDFSSKESQVSTTGYLFDISQLFEIYLEKLLSNHFPDWIVSAQEELVLYENSFYKRRMYPDIVMKHKFSDKVIVFDAKFKKMRLANRDLDRADFYQIHTYTQYYQPNTIVGGLLYPIEGKLNTSKAHADTLFGLQHRIDTHFIVDGVELKDEIEFSEIISNEIAFVDRLKGLVEKTINAEIYNSALHG